MSGSLASLDELDSSLHGSSSCPEQTAALREHLLSRGPRLDP